MSELQTPATTNPPTNRLNELNELIEGLTGKESVSELGKKLAVLQRLVIERDIPVVILVDGWENSGKGAVINAISHELDPRYYAVALFSDDDEKDKTHNYLFRFWNKLPRKGHITFYDRSVYFKILDDYKKSTADVASVLEDIYGFIRMLVDDGTIVIKLFLDLSQKEQKKRLAQLETMPLKKLFLNKRDYRQVRHYNRYADHFQQIIRQTNYLYTNWQVIPMDDLKEGSKEAVTAVLKSLASGIVSFDSMQQLIQEDRELIPSPSQLLKNGNGNGAQPNESADSPASALRPLEGIAVYPSAFPADLFVPLKEDEYDKELPLLQEKARQLSFILYICGISTICAFEGNDAAGKGGTIKRLTKEIDPRGYDIHQTAAPTKEEASFHYMRRFMINLPPAGKIAIFDRTWYGRVLVERIEGFAAAREWTRAYQEINTIEQHFIHSGINLMKFFLAIDKDEQLRRFNDRQDTPAKRYKITDEDWRNREKWDLYDSAFQEMFYRTSTAVAPWNIIEGNNKQYARIKVLRIFVAQSQQILHNYEGKHPDIIDWKEFWKSYNAIG